MGYKLFMALQHDKQFQMRASEDFLRKIDDWRRQQPDLPSRSEAMRRLVERALEAELNPAPKAEAKGGDSVGNG